MSASYKHSLKARDKRDIVAAEPIKEEEEEEKAVLNLRVDSLIADDDHLRIGDDDKDKDTPASQNGSLPERLLSDSISYGENPSKIQSHRQEVKNGS